MEWLRPLNQIDFDFRRLGNALLVDTDGQLKILGRKSSSRDELKKELQNRSKDMITFLTARARKGETE